MTISRQLRSIAAQSGDSTKAPAPDSQANKGGHGSINGIIGHLVIPLVIFGAAIFGIVYLVGKVFF